MGNHLQPINTTSAKMKIHTTQDLLDFIEADDGSTGWFQMKSENSEEVKAKLEELQITFAEYHAPNLVFQARLEDSETGLSINFYDRLRPSKPKKEYVRRTGIAAAFIKHRL